MKSPSIDLGLLSDASSTQHEQELRKLCSVLNSWGCLQLVNHGKELFALPLEQKQKHNTTLDWFEGYGGATISEGQNYNWNDRLHLRVNPVDQRNFNFWPEYILNFRETLEEYAVEVRRVTKSLLKAIAKSVELDEDSFLKECGEDEMMRNGKLKSVVHKVVIDKE
ncbi:S-norcoclaurine synthase 1-like [Chenopodium quinoa]|uniref:S-norcoclaurine synthase 1-like n=1 Tax=Chenopodium quinoa TaxID=63459 RepID=UPI000B793553|nr:S-norcoclaurine synthase 1-like [Chenopodium quinoa]